MIIGSPQPRGRIHLYPDIQYESQHAFECLTMMLNYSLATRPDLVLFTGDLTESNLAAEWTQTKRVTDALAAAGIKWIICTGNHDTDPSRNTLLNTYLTAPAWISGVYAAGHLENTYSLVDIGGTTWLVLSLEFGPRDAVVTWAAGVLAAHPTTPTILLTHAFLYHTGVRYDWALYGPTQLYNPHQYPYTPAEGTNDGQDLWNALIAGSSQVRLVLCGHDFDSFSGTARAHRTDARLGTNCVQIVRNFQEFQNTGVGVLAEIGVDNVLGRYFVDTVQTTTTSMTASSYQPWITTVDQFTEPM